MHSLSAIALAFMIVAVSPGPATLSNAAVAMHHGRETGLVYGAGLACGLAAWGLVAATGVGALLQASTVSLTALRVAGGLYLLWLALGSMRSALRPAENLTSRFSGSTWFVRGLVLNLSNPKAMFAWMAALSVGLGPENGFVDLAVATLVCGVIGGLVYLGYTMLFSIEPVMGLYRRLRHWIDGAMAALYAAAGLGLVRSAIAR